MATKNIENHREAAPPKEEWKDHVDTTLAHNRGTMGNAQLAAERSGRVETAAAPPAPERATGGPQADLSTLTVAALKTLAKSADIEGYSTMLKAELVAALS